MTQDIKALMERPELKGKAELIIDATGEGKPFIDFVKKERLNPIGVTITGGEYGAKRDQRTGLWHIDKQTLVVTVRALFGHGQLKIAKNPRLRDVLLSELEGFTRTVNSGGHSSFNAVSESVHDDLVIALSLAAWRATNFKPVPIVAGEGIGRGHAWRTPAGPFRRMKRNTLNERWMI